MRDRRQIHPIDEETQTSKIGFFVPFLVSLMSLVFGGIKLAHMLKMQGKIDSDANSVYECLSNYDTSNENCVRLQNDAFFVKEEAQLALLNLRGMFNVVEKSANDDAVVIRQLL